MQGQRWHFTLALPSTAVGVVAGKKPTTTNIEEIADSNHVILSALDIKAFGNLYVLKNDNDNNTVTIQRIKEDGTIKNTDYDVSKIPHKIVSVQSVNNTSRDDLATSGTH